jgi:SAM domain (Sterile alpha motif)
MQQIEDWLKKLGMSEYAQRFVENRIDLSVLPDLTDQHLEKLGVALGDRLKICVRSGSFPTSPWPRLNPARLPHLSCKIAPSDASSR